MMKGYEGSYLHAIRLNDWYPCWNLSLSGRLYSPDFAAACDPGLANSHRRVRDISIEELKLNGPPQGVFTHRATWYVWAAAIIRREGHVGIGQIDTKWLNKEKRDQITRLGDIELMFENRRRKTDPEAVSRMSCLWVAEDNNVGKAHIRAMLGPSVHILKVTIPIALNVTRVDTSWFDLYCQDGQEEYLNNYWAGKPFDNAPKWELLVDGMIEAVDDRELKIMREHCAHLDLPKQL